MNSKGLRKFIKHNNRDCALLIGNGINRCAQSGCLWEVLLKALAHNYCPSLNVDVIPEGISNTEFFDLLEIYILKETSTYDIKKESANIRLSKFQKDSLDLLYKQIKECALNSLGSIDKFDKYVSQIKKPHKLFTPDLMRDLELGTTILTMGDKFNVLVNSGLINSICSYMNRWTYAPIHKRVALFAKRYKLPILTTNYDNLLAKAINADYYDYGNEYSNKFHPISCCFTDCKKPNFDNFGIWHINGLIQHPQSILIGLSHYMRSIEHIRSIIFPSNQLNAELFQGNYWGFKSLKNTWINLIFSKNLVIAGISLNENEVFLRWLLLERAKFFALFPNTLKRGFYIMPKSENLPSGKEYFLKSVGIEIVSAPDFESVYNVISV